MISRTTAFDGRPAPGLFAGLKVGRPVVLKDEGVAYEIDVMDDQPSTGQEVAEVGGDYLVIKDVAGVETRIPVTSIKAIVRISAARR